MSELIATSVTTFPLHYNIQGKLAREKDFVQVNIAPKIGKMSADKTFQNLEITTDEAEIGIIGIGVKSKKGTTIVNVFRWFLIKKIVAVLG